MLSLYYFVRSSLIADISLTSVRFVPKADVACKSIYSFFSRLLLMSLLVIAYGYTFKPPAIHLRAQPCSRGKIIRRVFYNMDRIFSLHQKRAEGLSGRRAHALLR